MAHRGEQLPTPIYHAASAAGPAADITGAEFGRGFQLTDHTGKPRTLEDFSKASGTCVWPKKQIAVVW